MIISFVSGQVFGGQIGNSNPRLGWGLVIQVQLSSGSMHPMQSREVTALEEKDPRQSAISVRRRSEQSRVGIKRPGRCESKIGVRRAVEDKDKVNRFLL